MKLLLLAFAFLGSSSCQIMEPLIGLLAPAPPNLLTIRGPVYVEPSALQPPLMLGPSVPVGPPILGQPMVTGPVMTDPLDSLFSFDTPIINRLGTPVISPNPFNPYQPQIQIIYDEDQKTEQQAQLQNDQFETLQKNPNARLYESQNVRFIPQTNLNLNQRLLQELLNHNNLNQRISENQVYQMNPNQQNLNNRYLEGLNNQHNQRLNEIRMLNNQNLQNQYNARLLSLNQNMPEKRWIWYYNQRRTLFDEPDDDENVEKRNLYYDPYAPKDIHENDEEQADEDKELVQLQRSQFGGLGLSQNQINPHQNVGLQMQKGYFQGQRRLFDESTLFDDETSDDSNIGYRRR